MVHRMLLLKVGGRYIHLLKMFGALFTFASAFFVLNAAYQLNIILESSSYQYQEAQLMRNAGVMNMAPSLGDVFGRLTAPIGSLFLWLGLMVIGLALYRSDRTIFPLEEDVTDYPEARAAYAAPAPAAARRQRKR